MRKWLRLFALARGEAGASPWRAWPLAAGLTLGVGCLIFLLGIASGVEQVLKERVAGTLPDRVKVSTSTMKLGPLALGGGLDDAQVESCRKIPHVTEVWRQAHFPAPCQLYASYGGQNLVTDLVLEGVDPGQVLPDVAPGKAFGPVGPNEEVPSVIPQADLDIINAGISSHTSLPQLSEDALIGRHFTILVGRSSFSRGAPGAQIRAVAVGVSDTLGVAGPAVPLDTMRTWTTTPIKYHTLTLKVDAPENVADVVSAVHQMGLATPGVEAAERIATVVNWARLGMALFSLAVLVVAAAGVSAGLTLQVREEARWIGLYRAVGATRRDILTIYLARAGLLGTAGSVLGLILGVITGRGLEAYVGSQLPPGMLGDGSLFRLSWGSALGSLAFGVGITLVSGWWPARQAAHLRPVDALRGD